MNRKYIFGDNFGKGGTIEKNLGQIVLQNCGLTVPFEENRSRFRNDNPTKIVNYHILYVKTKENIVVIGNVSNKEKLERLYSSILKGYLNVNPINDNKKLEEKIKNRILRKEEIYDNLLFLNWEKINEQNDRIIPLEKKRYPNINIFSNF